MPQISRRDFLKVAGTTLAGALVPDPLLSMGTTSASQPNIIVILCDALSARHLSLYGYPRTTTPFINVFADYATVYHQHVSGGNFTTTGTASFLSGMFGWKHRAINQGGLILPELASVNPFSLLGTDYYKFAFSQNPWSERLVGQNCRDVDGFLPVTAYSLREGNLVANAFKNDRALASIAVDDFLLPVQGDTAGSSILGSYYKSNVLNAFVKETGNSPRYPNGIPEIQLSGYVAPYLNEDVYNGVYLEVSQLENRHTPYFAFFHLFSPHFPYSPRSEYYRLFRDDFAPPAKPVHPLSPKFTEKYLLSRRTAYDRQIAQVDNEFGRLVDRLDKIGVLENSYLIFTSDHGELFERGFAGHGFQFMYEPVLHVPLLVHAPGQSSRKDVYSPTSNADILPTLLHITGRDIPSEIDGAVLPGLGGTADLERPIFSVCAVDNSAFGPLKKTVIAMRKGGYKLIAYLGYENFDQVFELYDLTLDPEELVDISSKASGVLSKLKQEFFFHLENANKPFVKN
jgi:hypothetical protein